MGSSHSAADSVVDSFQKLGAGRSALVLNPFMATMHATADVDDAGWDDGYELETAGSLKGGRKLWALARTGQGATLKGRDTVHG